MATADLPITLNAHDTLTLEQALIDNNLKAPLAVSLSQSFIHLNATETASSSIELVVFSDIKIAVLSMIFQQCQLTPSQLGSINHRNNKTSVRFNVACEDLAQARKALVNICLDEKIEAAIVKQAPSLASPGLLVMDMDSTTIEIECIDEIAKLAGVGEQVAAVTEEAMQGKLDFAESLNQRVATLEDAPESILADVARDIPLMPGLTTLIEVLKAHNWRIAIASGGFTYFADHLRNTLQLDAARANTLEIVDGKLTGKVLGGIVDAQVKADVLQELAQEFNIAATQTVAMGDGANDLVMMAAAHLGVAYKAKPLVLAKADTSISHSGLDCMLHWLK